MQFYLFRQSNKSWSSISARQWDGASQRMTVLWIHLPMLPGTRVMLLAAPPIFHSTSWHYPRMPCTVLRVPTSSRPTHSSFAGNLLTGRVGMEQPATSDMSPLQRSAVPIGSFTILAQVEPLASSTTGSQKVKPSPSSLGRSRSPNTHWRPNTGAGPTTGENKI